MRTEKSCGVIPFIEKENQLFVLLINQTNGVICFPKGHVEPNESEEETAIRECVEETNLKPTIVDGFREEISYFMPEYNANKVVVYFAAFVDPRNIEKQIKEIDDIYICSINEAYERISYEDTKNVLTKATEFVNKRK